MNGVRRVLWSVRSTRTRAVLSLGVAVSVGVTGSYAYWSDSVAVTGTSIASGTIDLKVNNADAVSTFTSMSLTTMVPGNSTAGVLTVKNAGTAPLTYYVDAATTNADGKGLGAALVAKVTGDASTTGTSPAVTCAGTALTGGGAGFGPSLVGSAASPRVLAASASETLCLQASLPSAAQQTLSGASTTVTFTFTASQVP